MGGELKNCTRISVSLNNDVLAELDRRAEQLACPRSVYIAIALRQKWQTEDNMANMPAMMTTLGNAVRIIEEYKSDPAMNDRLNISELLSDTEPTPTKKRRKKSV